MDGAKPARTAAPDAAPLPAGPPGAAPASLPAGPPRAPRECGDFAIRISRDGAWHYRGSRIDRKELCCLFAGVLRRGPEGGYWLETPVERGRIEVEDAPFVAVEMYWRQCNGRQCLTFRTSLDQMVTADADHPIRVALDPATREPRPYVTLRPGIEARINRAVFYELVALAVPETVDGREVVGVWSEGVFFPIDDAVPPDGDVAVDDDDDAAAVPAPSRPPGGAPPPRGAPGRAA